MPGIPHSWVSGESRMGKNKVSFNREQCRAWETRWLCFSPMMSQCRKQGRAIFKTPRMWKQTLKQVWVVLFIRRPYHPSLYSKNTDLFMAEADSTHLMAHRYKHHYSALIFSALSPSNRIRVNTPAAHSSKSETQHHGTHLHEQLTWHLCLLDQ